MEIAYAHHERWDGRGYPGGLAGEAIPLAARLVAVVDAYDAITSERPYKAALSHDVALGRMARDRGTHFDPDLLDLFLGVSAEIAALAVRLRAAG
jgi:putative two-component system response regulator